ncbi:MAG: hypothetical protein AAGH81_09895 [Bacteroidota bacterium]
MTGSVALDVVIGLIFIFLLYSLLASILQEMIANFIGLRARNLRHGISRMLKDGPKASNNIVYRVTSDSKERIKRNFVGDGDNLVETFYRQPVIKYLASGNYFSKPSYIDQADFAKALLDILKKGGDPNTPAVTTIREALSKTDDFIGEETRSHVLSLLDDAQNDLVKFKANLETWFNSTMERVTGWYKRTVQLILILIGFGIAVSFNVNTLEIAELLAVDEEARNQMVVLASNYIEENEKVIKLYQKDKETKKDVPPKIDSTNQVKFQVDGENADTQREAFNTKLDSLLRLKAELDSDIDEATKILGFRPPENLPAVALDTTEGKANSKQLIFEKCQKKYLVTFPSKYMAEQTGDYYSIQEGTVNGEKVTYAEFNDLSYLIDNFWGYVITALAISLGAPFWFDLLSKLIRIRNSIRSNTKSTPNDGATLKETVPLDQRVG